MKGSSWGLSLFLSLSNTISGGGGGVTGGMFVKAVQIWTGVAQIDSKHQIDQNPMVLRE